MTGKFEIHEVLKSWWTFFLIVLFGCWLAGQANSDHVEDYDHVRHLLHPVIHRYILDSSIEDWIKFVILALQYFSQQFVAAF